MSNEYDIESLLFEVERLYDQWDEYSGIYNGSQPFRQQILLEELYENQIEKLFYHVGYYLENKGMQDFLKRFKKDIEMKYAKRENLYSSTYHEESGMSSCNVCSDLRKLLSPTNIFHSRNNKYMFGLKFLERILEGTHLLVVMSSEKVKGEPSIYNAVKKYLSIIFPRIEGGQASFRSKLKRYNPDVLIPELKAAVEYKYAKSEKDITRQIDELVIDAEGYIGDDDYNHFYGVIYTKGLFMTQERFNEALSDKKILNNWKIFMVQGE